MFKLLFLITTILINVTLLAQDRSSTIREIRDLSYQIEQATYSTRGNAQSLNETAVLMRRALSNLTSRPGNGQVFTLCRDYAFPILNRTLPSGDAMDEAIRLCRTVVAFDEMKFLYTKYSRTLPSREAMEKAANFSDINLLGKLDILSFAFEKYNRVLPSSVSCDRAAKGVSIIQRTRGTLSCFNNTFPVYNRTSSSVDAMDRTIQACQ